MGQGETDLQASFKDENQITGQPNIFTIACFFHFMRALYPGDLSFGLPFSYPSVLGRARFKSFKMPRLFESAPDQCALSFIRRPTNGYWNC